jgi:hypothetical protein
MPGLDLPCKLVIKQSVIISIIPGSIQCSCVVTSPKFQSASFITSLVSLRPDQPYPFEIQVQLVKAVCCWHNIIRVTGGDDLFDELWKEEVAARVHALNQNGGQSGDAVTHKALTATETNRAKNMRNDIANRMWLQFSKRQI